MPASVHGDDNLREKKFMQKMNQIYKSDLPKKSLMKILQITKSQIPRKVIMNILLDKAKLKNQKNQNKFKILFEDDSDSETEDASLHDTIETDTSCNTTTGIFSIASFPEN